MRSTLSLLVLVGCVLPVGCGGADSSEEPGPGSGGASMEGGSDAHIGSGGEDAGKGGAAGSEAGVGGKGGSAGSAGAGGSTAGSGGTAGQGGEAGSSGAAGDSGVDADAGVCSPGDTQPCYSGPDGTKDKGICKAGTQKCKADGSGFEDTCEGEVLPSAETCAGAEDEDCDGQVNEEGADCACVPGSEADCYGGPDGTLGVGLCKGGKQTCNPDGLGYGTCVGQVVPVEEDCATAEDENCDGQVNEAASGCACEPGATMPCYEGPAGTQNVGICVGGTATCASDGKSWGACVGQVLPGSESCTQPGDEDCDGQTNEEGVGCLCTPGSTTDCYEGPLGTQNVGICVGGKATCNPDGTTYGACVGQVLPAAESCEASGDEDCDGLANEEGLGCVCVPGAQQPCYEGAAGTMDVGICHAGVSTCTADGKSFGACVGQVIPAVETCNTAEDDDCDGQVNESGAGCVCAPGSTAPCYDGPAGTENVGLCKGGQKTCNSLGTAYGACVGQVLPAAETCTNLEDEDCDGQSNESGAGCVCVPGTTAACYEGPAGTLGVGICVAGLKTCEWTGASYGACNGQVTPKTESCATTTDDDCNGSNLVCTNAGDDCNPNSGQCVSACSADLLGSSYIGCEYYPTVTANLVATGFHFAVAVSNTSDKPATVTITQGSTSIASATVAAKSVQTINLPWNNSLKGPASSSVVPFPASVLVADGAYRLVSNRPVTVYQYNPLEYAIGGTYSYSNDASLLLPVNAWRSTYRVASRHHFYDSSGFLAVTAAQDNTQVTLAPGASAVTVKAGVTGIGTNLTGTVTLNAGDVMEIVTNGSQGNDPNDVTGALVTSSKPVQVIGGHQCIYVPYTTGYCDHLEESMFPIETLAKDYFVSAPLIPNGNTPKANMVRIVATAPNTTLAYAPAQAGAPTTIAQAGGWVEFQTDQSFRITSSEKVLVSQYMLGQDAGGNSGDPAMTLAVTTAQFRTSYLFHAPTNYEKNFVNITAPANAAVMLDGVAATGFTPIGSTGFSVARVQLSNSGTGNHTITSNVPVGITVYGYGQYTSYWYPGGLDLKILM